MPAQYRTGDPQFEALIFRLSVTAIAALAVLAAGTAVAGVWRR